MSTKDFFEWNKDTWNQKTGVHVDSDFYDHASFLKGKSSLNSFELALLGDVKGKKILHLQCHFGQDTLSLARMGAQVTGVDLSNEAIDLAKNTASELNLDAEFICCNVFDLKEHLQGEFDIVFTSYGTIGWLPDLNRWADIVQHFLAPQGQFIFVEFHPVIWMFDDDFTKVAYNYFQDEPIIEEVQGTYANPEADLVTKTASWNHGLGEVFQALKEAGVAIYDFKEYNYSPYNCLRHMEEYAPGKFRIQHLKNNIPYVYSLVGKRSV